MNWYAIVHFSKENKFWEILWYDKNLSDVMHFDIKQFKHKIPEHLLVLDQSLKTACYLRVMPDSVHPKGKLSHFMSFILELLHYAGPE